MDHFLVNFEQRQELVQKCLAGNAAMNTELQRVELEIESVQQDCARWEQQQGGKRDLRIVVANLAAERASIEVLENRIQLAQRKIAYLQSERANRANAERAARNQALTDSLLARERFIAAHKQCAQRRTLFAQTQDAQRQAEARTGMDLELAEEEVGKLESEISQVQHRIAQAEASCHALMETMAEIARSRRTAAAANNTVMMTPEPPGNRPDVLDTIDLAHAFERQRKQRQAAYGKN